MSATSLISYMSPVTRSYTLMFSFSLWTSYIPKKVVSPKADSSRRESCLRREMRPAGGDGWVLGQGDEEGQSTMT